MAVTFPKHAKALRSALQDIGVKEQPNGSNSGPRIVTYQRATWLPGTGWTWCVAFCLYHLQKAGGFILPYRGAGAYAYLDWARANGWAVPAGRAVPGDMVVFNIGAGHMAMLEKIAGGEVHTVDGNVSNQVARRVRPLGKVRGFVHVPEKEHTLPPAKPPVFEVVTSASGHKVVYVSGARAVGRKLAEILRRHPEGVTIRRKKAKAGNRA